MSKILDRKKQWVDEEDDDEQLPSKSNIVKERLIFSENFKGQKLRTVTKYRTNEVKVRVPKRVIERRHLSCFGDAGKGEEHVTLLSKDYVVMEHPDDQLVEDVDDPTIKNTLTSFILKQQERLLARELDDSSLNDDALDKVNMTETETLKQSTDRYVPPGERMKIANPGGADAQGENTIRVSNLTKSVTDDDLRDLFEPFGKVLRVSLPKVEKLENGQLVKESRGFAYIAFANRDSAEAAMQRLQGHGYDHLIIKLEWAKPTKDAPIKEGGLSSSYVSGYGKQLAQDTKEKVSYASNLTGNTY